MRNNIMQESVGPVDNVQWSREDDFAILCDLNGQHKLSA
jgi:hypothetical protein